LDRGSLNYGEQEQAVPAGCVGQKLKFQADLMVLHGNNKREASHVRSLL
jgi:hypothetical protein